MVREDLRGFRDCRDWSDLKAQQDLGVHKVFKVCQVLQGLQAHREFKVFRVQQGPKAKRAQQVRRVPLVRPVKVAPQVRLGQKATLVHKVQQVPRDLKALPV